MKHSQLKQLIKEEIQKVLSEGGPHKYIGKYKGRFNMFIDDEGNTYIKDKGTNWTIIDIEDSEGNRRSDDEIKKDIINSSNRESVKDFKSKMRGY
jgi:hypothetical protein